MAQYQYDAPRGAFTDQVVKGAGSSIGTAAVRVIVDNANATAKADALRALDAVRARIVEDTWPPQ